MGAKLPPRQRIDYSTSAVKKATGKQRAAPIGERNGIVVRKRMKQRNEERHAHNHAQQFGDQAAACRRMPCVRCGRAPSLALHTAPHHEPPVSLGGKDSDTVPLCFGFPGSCHDLRGEMSPERFWVDVGLDPEDAKDAVREWMKAEAAAFAARLAPVGTEGEG